MPPIHANNNRTSDRVRVSVLSTLYSSRGPQNEHKHIQMSFAGYSRNLKRHDKSASESSLRATERETEIKKERRREKKGIWDGFI